MSEPLQNLNCVEVHEGGLSAIVVPVHVLSVPASVDSKVHNSPPVGPPVSPLAPETLPMQWLPLPKQCVGESATQMVVPVPQPLAQCLL